MFKNLNWSIGLINCSGNLRIFKFRNSNFFIYYSTIVQCMKKYWIFLSFFVHFPPFNKACFIFLLNLNFSSTIFFNFFSISTFSNFLFIYWNIMKKSSACRLLSHYCLYKRKTANTLSHFQNYVWKQPERKQFSGLRSQRSKTTGLLGQI